MPTVICENQHPTRYSNTRGSTMPHTCPTCGKPTVRARFHYGLDGRPAGWEPVPVHKARPAAHRIRCLLCGATRLAPSNNVAAYDHPVTMWSALAHAWLEVPSGAYVCWYHQEQLEQHS